MNKKRRSIIHILNKIAIKTKAYYIIVVFIAVVFLSAGIIFITEPNIPTYGDALWYCFVDLFTIGFGDYVATTAIGKVLSILLTAYATVVIAVITGVFVSLYTELCNRAYKATKSELIEHLEHLDKLSPKELRELANKIKKID